MRILHLRLKNLNSLVGEWSIDFTHPDYEGNGIFAITGPTGAGKSTLLDAICLALYGKTPRLDKISKNSNEIMARQTGECFAEVTFETARGKYRCMWSQQCSHKKAGGELQNAKREIVDAETGTILESYLSRVEAKIEEITGMDFHRFTRSMLLAQGSFDAFLKASPSERAPILEQITGTEIYTRISIGVFERTKQETKRLDELKNESAAISLLSEADEINHTQEYQEKNKECVNLSKKLLILNEHKIWRAELDNVSLHKKNLDNEWNAYIEKENAALIDLKRLEQALKAQEFEGFFRDLCNLRKRQEEDLQERLKEICKKVALEKSLTEKNLELEECQKKYTEQVEQQKQTLTVIQNVRDLDIEGKRGQDRLHLLSEKIANEESQAGCYKKSSDELHKQFEAYKSELQKQEEYFKNYANDESLLENFSSIKNNFDRLKTKKELISEKLTELTASSELLKEAKNQAAYYRQSYDESKNACEKITTLLKRVSSNFERVSKGKDSLQWENERSSLDLLEKLCENLRTTIERYQNCDSSQKTIAETVQTFEETLKICQEEEKCILHEKEMLELKTEELVRQQTLQNRILSLEEERTQLADNSPCPLCGSLVHPYAHENIPELRKVDELLIELKRKKNDLEKDHQNIAKKISRTETEIRNLAKDQQDNIKLLTDLQEKSLKLSEQLNFPQEGVPTLVHVIQRHENIKMRYKEFEQKRLTYLSKGQEKENSQKTYNNVLQKHSELEKQLGDLLKDQDKRENDSNLLKQGLEYLKNEYEEIKSSLLESVRIYGFFTLPDVDSDAIKDELTKRMNSWKHQQNAKKNIEENIQKITPQITAQRTHLERTNHSLKILRDEKKQCTDYTNVLLEKRQHLFGTKDPDKEEESLKNQIELARTNLDGLKSKFREIQLKKEHSERRIHELTGWTQERSVILDSDEKKFTEQIHRGGFSGLEAYQNASLDPNARMRLAEIKNSLEMKKSELSAEKKVSDKKLSELLDASKTADSLITLEGQIQEVSQKLEIIRDRVFELKFLLAENQKKLEGAKILLEKITRQENETETWKGLSNLIGAADGKKFRDFAQKMTLEMMIAHANKQLLKMSDRYLLKQSKTSALELEVVDNYQAGEERSVKNLSGGEGFIVSLSLALGLSQMSSSKVKVDTLFLDEGFGTLDERALEIALDTLSELHQEGKVIGVISHVTVLKERISTQIKVQPISGGRSRIEGPGCTGN